MDQVKIGRFITELRKEREYTQRQLTNLLGIRDKTVTVLSVFLGFALLFGILRRLFSKKVKNLAFSYMPLILSVAGILFCLAAYIGVFGTHSESVIAENRYFALAFSVPTSGAFVGCLWSLMIEKRGE